jgi:hypothetical protein
MPSPLCVITPINSEDHARFRQDGWEDAYTFTGEWCPKHKIHVKGSFENCDGLFTFGLVGLAHGHSLKQLVKMKKSPTTI